MSRLFLILVLSTGCFGISAAEVLWNGQPPVAIDNYMQFTVADGPQLTGKQVWTSNSAELSRDKHQYLHFQTTIFNHLEHDTTVWFVIPFPAIKHVYLTDGYSKWTTGDALPFQSRPIEAPDYIFPILLEARQSTTISGAMQGEILRYSFLLTTPEYTSTEYRHNLIRDMTFFGAMASLVITCLIIFLSTKYLAYLSFAVFTFSMGAWFFRVFGYGFEILWPNYPQFNDVSYAVLVYAVMASSAWMTVSILQRQDRKVRYQNFVYGYAIGLLIAGVFSSLFLSLDTTLRIPLYWFFPFVILMVVIIFLEHRDGSQKARWFAYSMSPITLGAAIIVLSGLGVEVPFDVVMTMMLGIVVTCLFLAVMISAYLIKLLQSQRDDEQRQAAELEELVEERTKELKRSNQRLNELASKDPLTGLPNRRSLDIFVDKCIESDNFSIGIAMLDLDHFKLLNDTYGHDVGDLVLQQVALVLQSLNTENQIAGRFGGEEFAIIFNRPDAVHFESLLNEIHQKINQILLLEYPDIQVRACIGWVLSVEDESVSQCFRRADKALYVAKEQGRNQIVTLPYTAQ